MQEINDVCNEPIVLDSMDFGDLEFVVSSDVGKYIQKIGSGLIYRPMGVSDPIGAFTIEYCGICYRMHYYPEHVMVDYDRNIVEHYAILTIERLHYKASGLFRKKSRCNCSLEMRLIFYDKLENGKLVDSIHFDSSVLCLHSGLRMDFYHSCSFLHILMAFDSALDAELEKIRKSEAEALRKKKERRSIIEYITNKYCWLLRGRL